MHFDRFSVKHSPAGQKRVGFNDQREREGKKERERNIVVRG